MTDKATIEITSPKSGLVHKLHCDVGDTIEVHTPLIEINTDGSAAPAIKKQEPAPQKKPDLAPAIQKQPTSAAPVVKKPQPQPQPQPSVTTKVLASPAVRAFANTKGIDLTGIQGTGKGGRISRADVEAVQTRPTPIRPPAIQVAAPKGQDEEIKIIGLRRKIAEKMLDSVQRAPHFTYVDEIDVTELVALRKKLKPIAEAKGVKLTYLPFIMKALAQVFIDFPTVNANMNEEKFSLIVRHVVNIGIATDTPQGLFVPVIKDVRAKNIIELAHEIADVTTRTRENRVQLQELQGGTFTITSVGNIGGRFATPIINHPEVAILGVNQIHDRPMVIDGQIVARKMMYLSPSFDHRIIDGAVAARFVSALKVILENPQQLLLELR